MHSSFLKRKNKRRYLWTHGLFCRATDDFYLGFNGTIKVDNCVWLAVKETPVWSVEFIHSQFELFTIGKSDRSDRNKMQFLRIITI